MNMRISKLYGLICCIGLFCLPRAAFSQVTVTGPTCVIPGFVYLYDISGKWVPGSTVNVCVTGGILVDSGTSCAGGSSVLSFVRVSWDSAGQGSLAVSSSLGNTSLSVSITKPLTGGQIDSLPANQSLDTATTPVTLTCSASAGGGCQPAYSYQWQQSVDKVTWRNIPGATTAHFPFTGPLAQISYYRRVVTDNSSNTLAYSNVATVFVNTPMPTAPNLLNANP
jgi:hypothetical protein